MVKISIIHFQPLEYFPPALNFVRYLSGQDKFLVSVATTRQANQPFRLEIGGKTKVNIFDMSNYQARSRFGRALRYIGFIFATVRQILNSKPDVIVYFDPYSAWPAIIYCMIFNRRVRLWIHFHEYFAPEWYSQGMLIARVAHYLETRYAFDRAIGISQTNSDRVRLFLDDHPSVDGSKLFAFPNYPPSSWGQSHRRIDELAGPTKFVALGSLTLKGTYLGEFCEWVHQQNGAVELDVYSLYFDEETKNFLHSLNSLWIRFHPKGIPYDQIPELFTESAFHVGLVLYRCDHVNTIHCVSNKVFEYLVCGLDVWYPREMVGTTAYATNGIYPKVLPVDFNNLDELQPEMALSRDGHSYLRRDFNCELVNSDWVEKLTGFEGN